jgi:phytanoyl-CoA hydroxylase
MAPARTNEEPVGLTKDQLATFEQDGYLLIPDALSPESVSALLQETHSLLDNLSLDDHVSSRMDAFKISSPIS